MQSAASSNLIANSTDGYALPAHLLEIKWAGSWVDESANLIAASGSRAISDPAESLSGGGAGIAATVDLTLDNRNLDNDVDGKYSPFRTDSPLYPYIQNGQIFGKDVRLSLGYKQAGVSEVIRQFTGNIYDHADLFPAAQARLMCMDYAQKLIAAHIRTALYQNQRPDEILAVLAAQNNIASTDLDRDLFVIPYWWADSESTWDEINKLAQASGGRVYFKEDGTLAFENMHHWLRAAYQTPVWTIRTSGLGAITPVYRFDDVWDGVVVEYAAIEESYSQTIYEYQGLSLAVPPASVKSFTAQFQRPVTSVSTPIGGVLPTSDSGATNDHDNRDYAFTNAGGDDLNASISINLSTYGQRSEVTVTNSSTTYTAYLHRFRLRGRPLTGAPAGEIRYNAQQSVVSFPRTKEIRGNELVQTVEQAEALALFLRDRLEKPRLLYQIKHLQAVPMLQLGDRVTLVNTEQFSSSKDGFVVSIDWQYGTDGYYMDLTILDSDNLYPFALGSGFIVGTDTYGTKQLGY